MTQSYERLIECRDDTVGLHAFICIDSSVLGPADGGVRMRPYPSVAAATEDVTRLARAMTLKYAAAGEYRGGGKAVIIGDPAHAKTDALLRRFGQFVDSLGGAFWAGEDAGLTLDDMALIHEETAYVSTLPTSAGGVGDIAEATAAGVIHAMRACAHQRWGNGDLRGRRVAVQGVGACGFSAVGQLLELGAKVVIAEPDDARRRAACEHYGVEAVPVDDIYDVEADVFAPFAFGSVLDDETVARLRVGVVAGSANNVLAHDRVEAALDRRGIVHAVDFIANAGGCIKDADQFHRGGPDPARVRRNIEKIHDRTLDVFAAAEHDGVSNYTAARAMAHRRLRERATRPIQHS